MTQNLSDDSNSAGPTEDGSYADVAVVTVTTRNYLHRARALLESVKKWMPGAARIACCADPLGKFVNPAAEDYLLLEAESLSLPRYSQLVLALNPTAVCCALKPHAVAYAFQQPGIRRVLYLDNDIGLYRTPGEMLDAVAHHSFVLTPHHLAPLPPASYPNELVLNPFGAFNAGMFALRNCTEAMEFINWWGRWLLDPRHLEVRWGYDQAWLNYVPIYCPNSTIWRDPSYNVAFWNLVERNLRLEHQSFFCGSHPLTVFHFSHFDETQPNQIVSLKRLNDLTPTNATTALGLQIAETWVRHGREECLAWGYGHRSWNDGAPITESEREQIKRLWDDLPPTADLWSDRFRIAEPDLFRKIRADWILKQNGSPPTWRRLSRRLLDVTPRKLLRRLRDNAVGR